MPAAVPARRRRARRGYGGIAPAAASAPSARVHRLRLAGFVVSTAINQIGSRAFAKKPKAAGASPRRPAAGPTSSAPPSRATRSSTARPASPAPSSTSPPPTPARTHRRRPSPATTCSCTWSSPSPGHEVEEIDDGLPERPARHPRRRRLRARPPRTSRTASPTSASSKHLGTADQAADPLLMAESRLDRRPPPAGHRLPLRPAGVQPRRLPQRHPQRQPPWSRARRSTTPAPGTTAWTDNAALCIRDYLATDYGFNCDADEINDDYFIAAANVCDEAVTLSTAAPRTATPATACSTPPPRRSTTSTRSSPPWPGPSPTCRASSASTPGPTTRPSADIDLDMLAGGVEVDRPHAPQGAVQRACRAPTSTRTRTGSRPTSRPSPTPPTRPRTAASGSPRDIELPFTNHPEAAQRIAKVLLEKGRQGIQVELTLNHTALPLRRVGHGRRSPTPQLGWDDKVFRIKKLSTDRHRADHRRPSRRSRSASYDWNSGEASTDRRRPRHQPAQPVRPSPPPGALTVTEELYVTRDGDGVKAKAVLTWLASPRRVPARVPGRVQARRRRRVHAPAAHRPPPPPRSSTSPPASTTSASRRSTPWASRPTTPRPPSRSPACSTPPTEPQNLTDQHHRRAGLPELGRRRPTSTCGSAARSSSATPRHRRRLGQSTSIGNAVPGSATVAILPAEARHLPRQGGGLQRHRDPPPRRRASPPPRPPPWPSPTSPR